jgi:GNAT superfamily N-acetyltransferase
MVQAQGFVRFLARRGDAVAGGASMRLFEGIAQLCGAATLPEHRRHGVQSTLLAARLGRASRAGCELAVVTTQPGSKSQENVQKHGFELLYTRAILVPPS